MQWFRNRRLYVKILVIMSVMLTVSLVIGSTLLTSSFDSFTTRIGQQRAAAETEFLGARFAEIEAEVLLAADVMADNALLIDAVASADERILVTTLVRSLGVYHADQISVIDSDGVPVVQNATLGTVFESERPLISLALLGTDTTGIVSAVTDEVTTVRLLAGVPIKNQAGEIIAALLVGRDLDDDFWDAANFNRETVGLVLLSNGQVAAHTANVSEFSALNVGLIESPAAVAQAMNSQTVIGDEGVITEGGRSFGLAHMPVTAAGRVGGVLAVLADVSEMYRLRDTIFQTLTISLLFLLLIMLVGIVFTARQAIIKPLFELQRAAQNMLDGDYSQRVTMSSVDEVGQLGKAFNQMAAAIEDHDRQQVAQLVEVQKAHAEAERSNQVKSAFLASMSHGLRTPLNAIINYAKFVVKGVMGPVNEQQEDALNNVVNSAKHLLNLINDVLDISKIESGSLNLFIEDDVDMNDIIASATATAQSLLVDKPEVELQLELADQLPIMVGDRQRILQIILNIVSNACKFTDTGKIIIRADVQGDHVQIAVSDTGPGIAPDEVASVFNSFGQTRTGMRQGEGTGLGMPIAKNLTEAHGGRLWFESEPGTGSTFYVSLPVHTEMVPV